MQSKKWSIAATYGLILALITISYQLIQTVFEPGKAIALIMWAAKFGGTLYLLYYFIKEFAKQSDLFAFSDGFKFGILVSFFSSIICAVYTYFHFAVIFPDSIAAQMEQAMNMMQSNPDAIDQIAKIEDKLPMILFFVIIFYNTIFGMIASSIIANYTKKGDIFDNKESF